MRGEILANFQRGRGDNMGTGWLNDEADVNNASSFLSSKWVLILYDMAGNVSEWVLDIYRPSSSSDVNDFRAFRGNEFKTV